METSPSPWSCGMCCVYKAIRNHGRNHTRSNNSLDGIKRSRYTNQRLIHSSLGGERQRFTLKFFFWEKFTLKLSYFFLSYMHILRHKMYNIRGIVCCPTRFNCNLFLQNSLINSHHEPFVGEKDLKHGWMNEEWTDHAFLTKKNYIDQEPGQIHRTKHQNQNRQCPCMLFCERVLWSI